jgi:hypothetical protein
MKTEYGVVWCDRRGEQPGRLSIRDDSLVLRTKDSSVVLHDLPFESVVAVDLFAGTDGERELAITSCDADAREDVVRIESTVDEWIIRDLVSGLLEHALRTKSIPLRFLVSIEPQVGNGRSWHPGLGFS